MTSRLDALNAIRSIVANYEQAFAVAVSPVLKDQLRSGDALWDRKNERGHLTASAILLNEGGEALLVRHRALGLWLAPGGHCDTGEMPAQAAARELAEETGLEAAAFRPHEWHGAAGLPIDIDSHPIPANPAKDEAAHIHHDFRTLFRAADAPSLNPRGSEVEAAAWMPLESLKAQYPRVLERIRAILGQ